MKHETPMYKQTIIIWSVVDPTEMELDEIVEREAAGEFRVARRSTVRVDHPSRDKDFGVA